jgi:hypothetical protein
VKYSGCFFRGVDEKHHAGDPMEKLGRYHETAAEADENKQSITGIALNCVFSVP